MSRVSVTAARHGLSVIEDACEAVGSEYKGRPAGSLGDAGVFAFYPNKQATTGEGGMVLTNRDDLAALFRSLRNQGRDTMTAWLAHDRLGYNYRMSEIAAALGVCQFSRLDELIERRTRVAGWYEERLGCAAGIITPRTVRSTTRMSWFAYVVRLEPDVPREDVMGDLSLAGVPSRPYFTPIHLQPFYATQFGYRRGDFPATEALGAASLALPFSGTMTEADVARVCEALLSSVELRRGR
jgi:dTDP-4-amino-4,6-dideoxygalactose transaminase